MSTPLENKDRAARDLYKRLHSCSYCRNPLSLYDRLSGPCPQCGTMNQAGFNVDTPDAARALLVELTARRRELGLSDHP